MHLYDLHLVMPVYNEEEIIEEVVTSWVNQLRSMGIRFRMTCLNDSSKDGSGRILDELSKNIKELNVIHKPNSGHGPTILKGYRLSSDCEWVFQVDSDNEMRPEHFPKLWQARLDKDYLVGTRVSRESPWPRRVVTLGSQLAVSLFYGKSVSDVNSPYRLMRTAVFLPVFHLIPTDTFAPNVVISGVAAQLKARYFETSVPHEMRKTGEVSIKKWKLFKAAAKAFKQTIGCKGLVAGNGQVAAVSGALKESVR